MDREPKYEVVGHLATGGFATVDLARTRGIGGFERLLVLKRLLPELASNEELVQMFLDEARIAATLQHANIVQVHDVGLDHGGVFIAMELLHGQTVGELRRRARAVAGPIPLENAIAIVLGVCAGLHYAHDKRDHDGAPHQIVHRDVSARNVFVTYDGTVKVIDFGIAIARNRLTTTRRGTLKGSLAYMSPEQCRCEEVDRRTDVFAAGVLLYELTLGRPRFGAETEYQMMTAIVETDPPRPTQVDPGYPRALEKIVLAAMQRNRDKRLASAAALQHELEAFAAAQGLDVSQFSLAKRMQALFPDEAAACDRAKDDPAQLIEQISAMWSPDDDDDPTMFARPPIRVAGSRSRARVAIGLGVIGVGATLAFVLHGNPAPAADPIRQAVPAPAAPPVAVAPPAPAPVAVVTPVAREQPPAVAKPKSRRARANQAGCATERRGSSRTASSSEHHCGPRTTGPTSRAGAAGLRSKQAQVRCVGW